MIQPYKSCYDWKEGHKNPAEIRTEETQLPYYEELKLLLGKKFFLKGSLGSKTMLTIESAAITQHDRIYVSTSRITESTMFFPLEDCDFIVEIVNLK